MNESTARHIKQLALKRQRLTARQKIIQSVRNYFCDCGFLEMTTPVRIKAPAPELNIDLEPSGDHFLIASPELQMKQLVAAGYEKIFQINQCFRRDERGARHLPEFTMLEWYETNATMDTLKQRCNGLFAAAAKSTGQFPSFSYQNQTVTLASPWHHLEVQEAFERFADWHPGANPDEARFELDLVDKIEPALPQDHPTFLAGYPAKMASLAKIDPNDPSRALRLELYCCGIELANGFEELTDPKEQRRRFIAEESERRQKGKPPYPLDEGFLDALKHGLPSCSGMALGLDRLVMLLTDANKIGDVVAFP